MYILKYQQTVVKIDGILLTLKVSSSKVEMSGKKGKKCKPLSFKMGEGCVHFDVDLKW